VFAILGIVSAGSDPQVGSAVVEPVAIDVIDLSRIAVVQSEQMPAHLDRAASDALALAFPPGAFDVAAVA
jgi:hypothetical protein